MYFSKFLSLRLTKLNIVTVPALLSSEMNIPSSTLPVLNKSGACKLKSTLGNGCECLVLWGRLTGN